MSRVITEAEFTERLKGVLSAIPDVPDCVVGPGRSGAVASVYASYFLHIPFFPYGEAMPDKFKSVLIIDTAIATGKTMRRAQRTYSHKETICVCIFIEPPRVKFWYEDLARAELIPAPTGD